MSKKLLIVESPAKAKTIKKYLGDGYEVMASMGHVRDLPEKNLAIDMKTFKPQYVNMKGKDEVIKKLKDAALKSEAVILATDPDREGEAISWHLATILGLDITENNRVTFNEITKNAVNEGINAPRPINTDLVDAQQARRVLDRLVGYKLSPFLWKKVKKGLSAGRVQSVVCRMIVDREREIEAFIPSEYWNISAFLVKENAKRPFEAKYFGKGDKKATIASEAEANAVIKELENASFTVLDIEKSKKLRQPAAPFTTSTLQQDASRKLNFSSKTTMRVAQTLYEGVDIKGHGLTGLITYMRTDSLRISEDAIAAARDYIASAYGADAMPKSPKRYKAKSGAQDAHEAIRPSYADLTPAEVKDSLTTEQYKLYKLIWERFIASQMTPCEYACETVVISAGEHLLKSSDQKVVKPGFTVLYVEGSDDEENEYSKIPELAVGERLTLKNLSGDQKFTQPPSRYNEATLIKAMEENGIGRPSTYVPTISTVLARGYVEKEKKNYKATELGTVTTDLMRSCFPDIIDVKFTADMEKKLDSVEDGKNEWNKIVKDFYNPFEKSLTKAESELKGQKFKVKEEESDELCPNCGKNLVIRSGRFGKFLACPGYPACRFTKAIVSEVGGKCPTCGGNLIEKNTKRGKKFYGCGNYPKCNFASWDAPTKEACPVCGSTLFKKTGKDGKLYCAKEGCGYSAPLKKKGAKNDESAD